MLRLLETIVDRTAEILEQAEIKGEAMLSRVFDRKKTKARRPQGQLEDLLVDVAAHHRLVGKARDSLASLAA